MKEEGLNNKDKNNKWLTNDFSRGRVHLMRSQHDCLMTSVKTIINEILKITEHNILFIT